MKILTLTIAGALFLAGCTHTGGGSFEGYTMQQIREMPRFSSIERTRCPKARFITVKDRLECKYRIRIDMYEKRQNTDIQS